MKHAQRAVRAALPALAAVLLSGCGIPSTGVVEAGDPATGLRPLTLVYFVQDGALIPVARSTVEPAGVDMAVKLLAEGPAGPERLDGVTTDLPLPIFFRSVRVQATGVSIEISGDARPLSRIAVRQLVCTATTARRITEPQADPAQVTVTGPDGRRVDGSGMDCSA